MRTVTVGFCALWKGLPSSVGRPQQVKSFCTMNGESKEKFKLALLQIAVGADKQKNLDRAEAAVREAARNGSRMAMLPECFNCPYDNSCFPDYAEEIPEVGTSLSDAIKDTSAGMLQLLAAEEKMYIVGGSIPEKSNGKIYNTSVSVTPEGKIAAKHRKVHLFDINVPGKIKFQESEVLSAGNSPTIFNAGDFKVAVAICYDIRFPEFAMMVANEGAKLLCIPGAFNMTTGPAHWELLMRARALDNQMYVAACSPARDTEASYVAWGHSMVCNPWGEVIASTEDKEGIVYADIDMDKLKDVRESIPTNRQKRTDLYTLNKVKV
eukprot:Plantae.Rhodophyta-Purpureofilum_apyrenoidigerum.ctg7255.p1 GENE.Plantae.Rhodophyta-Purpureofilum_apyrenoidigerum.ctg7255~~Plantae.Rhodophyta-Purpureofilum_apyrenoidigerum.ctg7255.p1  ORF type:complete len:323 (-),score=61.04 Plantae.Rhodophyta-Purpureofilum_apyrenoidigerum.ctg7255:359-1327(-)